MLRSRLPMRGEGFILAALLYALTLASCRGEVVDFVDKGIGYDLSIRTDGGSGAGEVSVAASRKVLIWGTVVTLTPTPGKDYFFGGWSGENGNEVISDGSAWKLVMNGDKTVVANFGTYPVLMLSTDGGSGSGLVNLSPPGPTYELGTVVTLTPRVTVGDATFFALWSGSSAADLIDNGDRTYSIVMNDSKNLSAVFTKVAMTGGEDYSLIYEVGGSIWTFGRNDYGQLGNGTTTTNGTPTKLTSLTDVVTIAGGRLHSLAVTANGSVLAWGEGVSGKLGNTAAAASQTTPIRVMGVGGSGYLLDVVATSAGYNYSLAVTAGGSAYGWGSSNYGQLGYGSTTNTTTPVLVKGVGGSGYLMDLVAIAAGYDHGLALTSTGNVYAWGRNDDGQLGVGSTAGTSTPVQVKGVGGSGYLSDIVAIAGGFYHGLALMANGRVYAWGRNVNGQLGNGTTTPQKTPVEVLNLTDVVAISAGSYYSLALRADGTVYSWGINSDGQLGDGTTTTRTTPVQVKGVGGSGYLTEVVGIGSGKNHPFAVTSDGRLYAWGRNNYGELGDGSTANATAPVEVNIDF